MTARIVWTTGTPIQFNPLHVKVTKVKTTKTTKK